MVRQIKKNDDCFSSLVAIDLCIYLQRRLMKEDTESSSWSKLEGNLALVEEGSHSDGQERVTLAGVSLLLKGHDGPRPRGLQQDQDIQQRSCLLHRIHIN